MTTITEAQLGTTVDAVDLKAFELLTNALDASPTHRIEAGAMLSIDRPESIKNFKAMEKLLRDVYMAGAAAGYEARATASHPEGWKLMPPEMTDKMISAWLGPEPRLLPAVVGAKEKADERYRKHYRDMFEAAPSPENAIQAKPVSSTNPQA